MAREAKAHAPAAVADAARLPFAAATFDRVLALHMLYHCPDLAAAAQELRRVLRPGGVLIAVTNAPDHLVEVREVRRTATGVDPLRATERFNLANGGDYLRAAFDDVRTERVDGEIVVPIAQPVVDYVASLAGWDPAAEPSLRAAVDSIIERDGAFRARTRAGAFICR
jgi:SAM-dependent methyltransferase